MATKPIVYEPILPPHSPTPTFGAETDIGGVATPFGPGDGDGGGGFGWNYDPFGGTDGGPGPWVGGKGGASGGADPIDTPINSGSRGQKVTPTPTTGNSELDNDKRDIEKVINGFLSLIDPKSPLGQALKILLGQALSSNDDKVVVVLLNLANNFINLAKKLGPDAMDALGSVVEAFTAGALTRSEVNTLLNLFSEGAFLPEFLTYMSLLDALPAALRLGGMGLALLEAEIQSILEAIDGSGNSALAKAMRDMYNFMSTH